MDIKKIRLDDKDADTIYFKKYYISCYPKENAAVEEITVIILHCNMASINLHRNDAFS